MAMLPQDYQLLSKSQFDDIIYRTDASSSLKKTPPMPFNVSAFQKDITGFRSPDSRLFYSLVMKSSKADDAAAFFFGLI